jgi:hypothetical protein
VLVEIFVVFVLILDVLVAIFVFAVVILELIEVIFVLLQPKKLNESGYRK